MSLYPNSRRAPINALDMTSSGSPAVLGPIIALMASAVLLALFSVPSPLVLPALALVATGLAVVTGTVAMRNEGRLRSDCLTSSGIFALAAIAAGILGDPDMVAIHFK